MVPMGGHDYCEKYPGQNRWSLMYGPIESECGGITNDTHDLRHHTVLYRS